jgi:hypothetical protein
MTIHNAVCTQTYKQVANGLVQADLLQVSYLTKLHSQGYVDIWLCHMEVGKMLVLSPSTYRHMGTWHRSECDEIESVAAKQEIHGDKHTKETKNLIRCGKNVGRYVDIVWLCIFHMTANLHVWQHLHPGHDCIELHSKLTSSNFYIVPMQQTLRPIIMLASCPASTPGSLRVLSSHCTGIKHYQGIYIASCHQYKPD